MSEAVSSVASKLLSGTGSTADVDAMAPDQKGLLVDALLQGTFSLPAERARPLLDLCVSVSTQLNAPLRLYFSLVRRGLLNATFSPESASTDLDQAKGMLKGLGVDLSLTFTASSLRSGWRYLRSSCSTTSSGSVSSLRGRRTTLRLTTMMPWGYSRT